MKIKKIVNKVMDKVMNVLKEWRACKKSCEKCGEKIPPELRLCDDCAVFGEDDPFLNLLSERGFVRKINALYWEIRAEAEHTGQTFRIIKNRRLEEMGIQTGTPEWEVAEELIKDADADVAIGYLESQGDYEEEQQVREWERAEIDAALERLERMKKANENLCDLCEENQPQYSSAGQELCGTCAREVGWLDVLEDY